jgi:hypothetical protein
MAPRGMSATPGGSGARGPDRIWPGRGLAGAPGGRAGGMAVRPGSAADDATGDGGAAGAWGGGASGAAGA